MIRIQNLKLPLGKPEEQLKPLAAKALCIKENQITQIHLVKKSLDARNKRAIQFVYTLDVCVISEEAVLQKNSQAELVKPTGAAWPAGTVHSKAERPVIVGSGPAGLFCALALCRAGIPPIILERGKDAPARRADVERFFTQGVLNTASNIQFGEGGAGTFSDGKLTTGTKDKRIRLVLEEFVRCGAPEEILYLQKPHIGTDYLFTVVQNLRGTIEKMGGEYRFSNRFTGFSAQNGALVSIAAEDSAKTPYTIKTPWLILAIGHSARDTYEMLQTNGVYLAPKPFSVGVRIEHLQADLNNAQYGTFSGHPSLPAADYKLATHLANGRGVYTFCMCPGGTVVASSSEEGGVVTNGMSEFARDGENANSALLVSVTPQDFPNTNPLAGIELQRQMEQAAFSLGGGTYQAPCQTVADFLQGKKTTSFGRVRPTYPLGVVKADLNKCLPSFVAQGLQEALPHFGRKLSCFQAGDAVLTGVETRSSAPVRILRDDSGQANIRGIFPCGEGSGYAGGITSSAVDGMKCAEAVLEAIS